MSHGVYAFGDYLLDVAARELRHDGELLPLPASVFDCLTYLVEHRDRAVGRDELIAAVWGRTDVTDTVLGQTVLRARRAVGDTGNAQHSIRTVPRFGYRWVAPVERVEPAATAPVVPSSQVNDAALQPQHPTLPAQDTAPLHGATPGSGTTLPLGTTHPNAVTAPPRAQHDPADPPSAAKGHAPMRSGTGRRTGRVVALAALAIIAIAAAAIAAWHWRGAPTPTPAPAVPTLPGSAAERALVLPARIEADGEWRWLRLGLMDLIADHLQRARIATVPSESVVAITTAGTGSPGLDDEEIARVASWRVQPAAHRNADGSWTVTLDVVAASERFELVEQGGDVVQTTRAASDALLQRLGRAAPGGREGPPELDQLLQRTRAAMLEDEFELARALIADAPQPLRERPELVHRLAQIELRAGRYRLVQHLLGDLLERLPATDQPVMRGRALITLAASHVRRNQREAAGEAYEEAIALLDGREQPAALGLAYLGRGLVAAMGGALDTARAELGRARVEMEAAGDPLGVAQVDLNLGLLDDMRNRPADALPKMEASARRFESLRSREELNYTLGRIAALHNRLLDHDAALATSERFWPADSHSGNERLRWELYLVRARTLMHAGRLREARGLLDRLLAQSDPELDRVHRAGGAASLAELAFEAGDATAAASAAGDALTPALAQADPVRYLRTALVRVQALRRSGQPVDAAELSQWQAWAAGQAANSLVPAYADLIAAEAALAVDDWPGAQAAFRSALTRAEAVAVPDDLVAISERYTQELVGHGEAEEAQAVAGRIAPWADRDVRAARAQACLFAALHNDAAAAQAAGRARALAGERASTLPGCAAPERTPGER
jgi:DNA-binding winged helix-turn-helix (wHTH) protein/tetratricopeptide (TPR) repeat protein